MLIKTAIEQYRTNAKVEKSFLSTVDGSQPSVFAKRKAKLARMQMQYANGQIDVLHILFPKNPAWKSTKWTE